MFKRVGQLPLLQAAHHSYLRGMSLASAHQGDFDPYAYTSGRWLRSDEQQCRARSFNFDFKTLCAKAIACSASAQEVVRCTKIEGGFNRAFLLDLDDGSSLVARIPFLNAGPARLTTHSEVATIAYLRKYTSVPVPQVLDWSDDSSNPTGTEYIIMRHATGVQLHQRWPTMNSHQHMLTVKTLAHMVKELASLQLPAYGSLYFADAPVEKSKLIKVTSEFCVGPHCGNRYWPCTPGDVRSYTRALPNRGPWVTHEQYAHSLADAGLSRIPEETPPDTLAFKGSVDEHLELNIASRDVLEHLNRSDAIQCVARPTLLHPDIHKRNIFVSNDDPASITCIIDWQSSSIQPIYSYADEIPDLCEFPDTWDETQVKDPPSETEQRVMKDVSICRRTWEVLVRSYIPDLYRAQIMDQDLLRPFRYAASAWKHGAVPLRDDLIRISERWSQLRLKDTCPYQPTTEELAHQKALWSDFQMALDVKQQLVRGLHVDEDGWIPADRWEETKAAHDALFKEWLGDVVASGDMAADKACQIWPFDTPI